MAFYKFCFIGFFFCLMSTAGFCQSDIYDNIEFDMPVVIEPEFPDYSVSIKDFGAVGDGQTLNTEAITKAINSVAEKGGGRVIIPRGVWLTGPIVLKNNIDLHAQAGALVLFSTDKDLYPLIESYYEGREDVRCQSPISGRDLENIAFTGEGIYDGSGQVWRHVKRKKMTTNQWEKLLNSGGVTNEKGTIWYTSEGQKKAYELKNKGELVNYRTIEECRDMKDYYRPVMLSLINCNKILLDGPVFQNSPNWCLHPLMSENITVRNIDVRNPWFSQNGDGIDIESSKNVLVYDNTFDVGDDAICIKSGKDKSGRDRGMPSENIVVKNNVVYHGHGGIVVGSEMSGGIRNLHVSNCTFIGTDVGIRFKSKRGRGGLVENIFISNIDMTNILTNAISFNLYYGGKSVVDMIADKDQENVMEELLPVSEETPKFRNISIKNITCRGAHQAIYLRGLPEMNLQNIYLENINMTAKNGFTGIDVDGVKVLGLKLESDQSPSIALHNGKNIEIEGLEIINGSEGDILISGEKTRQVHINLENGSDDIMKIDAGVDISQIEIKQKKSKVNN